MNDSEKPDDPTTLRGIGIKEHLLLKMVENGLMVTLHGTVGIEATPKTLAQAFNEFAENLLP